MLETILVIDDDPQTRQSLAVTLESRDYLVFSAGSEDTAFIMARKVNPKVIFVNPAFAGGRGLEICKKIHGTEQLKNVPIIVLSAFEGAKDPHFAALYGIVDSLPKPFTSEDIIAKTAGAISPAESEPKTVAVSEAVEAEISEAASSPETPAEVEGISFSPAIESHPEIEKERSEESETPDEAKEMADGPRIKTRLPMALIAVVAVVVLGAAGFMFYSKGSLLETKASKTEAVKSAPPSRQSSQADTALPRQPLQADAENEPVAKPDAAAVPPAAPAAPQKVEKPAAPPAASINPVKTDDPTKRALKPKHESKQDIKAVYSVQIGVFKAKKNASTLMKRYENKGYEAFMLKATTGEKKVIYRVLIGKFPTKKEAADWAKKIGAEENIKTTVFKR